MRLIVEYGVGDGYTYSCDIIVPVEYESAEKFIVDFENRVEELVLTMLDDIENDRPIGKTEFTLGGQVFDIEPFYYYKDEHKKNVMTFPPTIYTVDEWFQAKLVK